MFPISGYIVTLLLLANLLLYLCSDEKNQTACDNFEGRWIPMTPEERSFGHDVGTCKIPNIHFITGKAFFPNPQDCNFFAQKVLKAFA